MKLIVACFSSLIVFLAGIGVSASVRLPAIIGSHMVLQQKTEVTIWGWCDAGEKVTLHAGWDTTAHVTKGSSGAKWSFRINTPAAGGPWQVVIEGYNKIILEDVLVGEVWVCSGQSNMEMSVTWGLPYQDDVSKATDNGIRFFHIPRTTAEYPQDDVKAGWVVCNPDDMKKFSAVGYFFADALRHNLNVPVGMINASWGGTPAEDWTPSELINNDAVLKEAAAKLKPADGWPVIPASTYNGMIHPIIHFAIAGTIWYQGEANVDAAGTYRQLMGTLIDGWRKAWQIDFPFLYVQIAPFAGYGDNSLSAFLREAQTKMLDIPLTGMVVVTDLVDNINDIHPKMKKEVGIRLANSALSKMYHKKGLPYKTPFYKNMKIEKGKIRIYFDNAENGLMSRGDTLAEFFIAGQDQHFVRASAKIAPGAIAGEPNTVIVWSKEVTKPVAVRFAFRNGTMPNLFSKEGLPVNPFRTDDWDVQMTINQK